MLVRVGVDGSALPVAPVTAATWRLIYFALTLNVPRVEAKSTLNVPKVEAKSTLNVPRVEAKSTLNVPRVEAKSSCDSPHTD